MDSKAPLNVVLFAVSPDPRYPQSARHLPSCEVDQGHPLRKTLNIGYLSPAEATLYQLHISHHYRKWISEIMGDTGEKGIACFKGSFSLYTRLRSIPKAIALATEAIASTTGWKVRHEQRVPSLPQVAPQPAGDSQQRQPCLAPSPFLVIDTRITNRGVG